MEISKLKFCELILPIVIGWSVGITTLCWISGFLVFMPSMLSDELVNSSGDPQSPIVIILTFIFGIPLIAAMQGVLISVLCYFGISIYRKIRRL